MRAFIFTILSDENEHLFFNWFDMAMNINKFPSHIWIIDIRKTKYHRVDELIRLNRKNSVFKDWAKNYALAMIRGIELSQQSQYNCCVYLDVKCKFDNDSVLELVTSSFNFGLAVPFMNDGDKIYSEMAIPTFSKFIEVQVLPGSNTSGMYPIPTMCWSANAEVIRSIKEFSFIPEEEKTSTYELFQQLGKAFKLNPHLTIGHV